MIKTNNMKQKCIHCDGLGYFYNQATFQSEHCPHCEGKGYIETQHDLGGPVEQPAVVEAPKTTKKTKAKLDEVFPPEVIAELTAPADANSGGDVDGSK